MRGVQAGIDSYTRGTVLVPSILGWMVRYGRDVFEDQEVGERRGGYLADARMETPPPFAETCW